MNVGKICALLGYRFKQRDLLEQALTHRSFSRSRNYERLEFLGDSVLNLVISNYIYHRFADADEGDLSRIRASLVKESALAEVARQIGLGDFINLGGGELKSGGFRRESILSDTLESIIGAIYLDSDYSQTEKTILHLYASLLQNMDPGASFKDPKTKLQEHLQAHKKMLPIYQIEKTTGKSHAQTFCVSCSVAELNLRSVGEGSSRKRAEQQAAQEILDKLQL